MKDKDDMIKRRVQAVQIDFAIVFILMFSYMWLYYKVGEPAWMVKIRPAISGLFFFRDCIKGRSIGRRVTGLKVVTVDGELPSQLTLLIRNILSPLFLILDFMHFGKYEHRFVDDYMKTRVVIVFPKSIEKYLNEAKYERRRY